MDTVKLEAKWPPDRKSTIDASEFGIYKEPADGKRPRGTERATGCLLVLSLIAAAAIVVYFAFFDYTIQSGQTASAGPVVSYARYIRDKQTAAGPVNRSADGLLAAVLGVKNAQDYTSTTAPGAPADDDFVMEKRIDDGGGGGGGALANDRHARMYPTAPQRPVYPAPYDSGRRSSKNPYGKLEYSDGLYGFGRRSDFPQLQAAYRAPFPPKSILDVMKYVTGSPPPVLSYRSTDYMTAQESRNRYTPIRPAEEVNQYLPDVAAAPSSNSKRFRNKFGPPAYVQPSTMAAFPDDFMKPPSLGARYATDFGTDAPLQDMATQEASARVPLQEASARVPLQEASARVPLHTDAVFHSPVDNILYPVPDAPTMTRAKVKQLKSKKPISVMLDIYPISDQDDEHEEYGGNTNSEMLSLLKNNIQHSADVDNLFLRMNLFPKYNSEGGRRISKNVKHQKRDDHKPTIHLTTQTPTQSYVSNEDNDSDEDFT